MRVKIHWVGGQKNPKMCLHSCRMTSWHNSIIIQSWYHKETLKIFIYNTNEEKKNLEKQIQTNPHTLSPFGAFQLQRTKTKNKIFFSVWLHSSLITVRWLVWCMVCLVFFTAYICSDGKIELNVQIVHRKKSKVKVLKQTRLQFLKEKYCYPSTCALSIRYVRYFLYANFNKNFVNYL